MLFVHGFSGSPHSMRGWAEHHAAAGLTVRLPRLPGHGTSWQELNRTRWQDWYGCVEREFAELRAAGKTVVVAGLSAGGGLAVRLAEVHPAEVAGLVLINPSVADDVDIRKRFLGTARWFVPSLAGITDDIAKPGVTEMGYARAPLHAAWSLTRLWATVRGDLAAVRCPLLVLTSAVDHVVPASSTTTLLRGVSSTEVTQVELTRSYHVATLDYDAELIRERSLAFVREVTTHLAPAAAT